MARRTFTVALVGGDGAGKTTIARRLEALRAVRCKYLYMGQSVISSDLPLPTSRLVRAVRLRSGGRASGGARDRSPTSQALHYEKRDRGLVRTFASLVNRFAEAWWRQVLSVYHRSRGYVVVYDRHYLIESAIAAGSKRARRLQRFEHAVLQALYPKPDLVLFLDASPETLYERKHEASIARLTKQRAAMLDYGSRARNFTVIDAERPVDEVFEAVSAAIQSFRAGTAAEAGRGHEARGSGRSSSRSTAGRSPISPYAIVVGLDHLNGIQTARLLAERGVPVIGVARDPKHYCCRTRVCDRILIADTGEPLVAALEALGPTLRAKAVLFPCTDMHVLVLSRHRDRLAPWYHLALPDADTVEMLMDKVRFYAFAQEHGLPIPGTVFVRDRQDAERAAREIAPPWVLKPPMSAAPAWERTSPLKAYVLATPDELFAAYDRFSGLADMLIVQQWVAGPSSNLISCNCYFDGQGRALATFVSRKLRQWPAETGESSLGQECRNDVVLRETLRLFELVKLRGFGYLEMKQDERTGEHFIIEPNIGRPTGRSPIAEAGGVPLVYTMYRDVLGMSLPEPRSQRYGDAKWIDLRRDLQSAVYHWRNGDLTIREWQRSVRGPKKHALLSLSDPKPFLGDLERAFRLFLSPEERRKRDYRHVLGEEPHVARREAG